MTGALLLLVAASGPPYYTRPADPAADLAALRVELDRGQTAADAWHERVRLYVEMGELQSTSALLDTLAAAFPDDPVFTEARMILASNAGDHDTAIALGERLLAAHPDHPTIVTNLARVHLAAGHRARGVNLLLAAVEIGPIRVEDWRLLLDGLGVGREDEDRIVSTLRAKVAERPDRRGLRYVLVVVLTRFGRYAEAAAILRADASLADHPDLAGFLSHLDGN